MLELPYALRVLCVASIGLGAVHVAFDLILRASLPGWTTVLARRSARFQERFFFSMALIPPVMAVGATSFLIVPAFISQETNHQPENAGLVCVLLSIAVWLWYGTASARSALLLAKTLHVERLLRRGARRMERHRTLWVVPVSTPLLVLVGFFRPRVLLSREMLRSDALSPEALNAALDHEYAHARQYDNWKLLMLSLIPRLPFGIVRVPSIADRWKCCAEWAADDESVAGNPQRALLLADSLLVFARSSSAVFRGLLATSLASHERDLSDRIRRLLAGQQPAHEQISLSARSIFLLSLAMAASAAAIFALPFLHEAAEYMLHLG